MALSWLERFEESLHALDRALALDPAYAKAWHWKARSLVLMDRFEEAMVAYRHAYPDGNPAEWWLLHGQVCLKLRDSERAMCAFIEARRLNPKLGSALAGMAVETELDIGKK